jgi:hypothetical protein
LLFNQSFYLSQDLKKIDVDEYGYFTMTKLKQNNYKKIRAQILESEAAAESAE